MAAVSRLFHVRPWELRLLSVWEFYHFCSLVDEVNSG